MPRNIPLPDGSVVRNVPDDVSDEQFQAVLAQRAVSANNYGIDPPDMEARVLGPAGMSAVRGVRDVAQGGIRLGLRGLEAVGVTDPATRADFEEYAAKSAADYEAKLQRNFPNASGVATAGGRMLGQMGATAPLAAVRIGQGVGLLSRLATNAAQGTAAGAVLARPDELGKDTALSAAASVVIPEAVRGGLALLGSAGSWMVKKTGGTSAGAVKPTDALFGQLSPDVVDKIKASGIDWDNLPDRVKKDTFNWVRKNAGKTELTPVEAARLGIFEGAPPTKAMVTRDTGDYNTELDLAKNPSGDSIKDAYARVNEGIGSKLEMETNRYQGTTTDKSAVGERVFGVLDDAVGETRKAVDAAWNAARADPRIANNFSTRRLRQYLVDHESTFLSDPKTGALAQGFAKELEKAGAGVRPVSVEKAEAMREWLNAQYLPNTPKRTRAIGQLKEIIDETVLGAGKGDVYEKAREAYQLGKQTYGDKELLRDLLSRKNEVDRKVATGEAFDRIMGSDPAQLRDFMNTLRKGSAVTMGPGESATVARGNEIAKDIQSTLLNDIAEKSQGPSRGQGDTPIFLHNKMQSAIDKIGKERLDIILGPEGRKELALVLEQTRLAKPLAGVGSAPRGSSGSISRFFRDYFPRMVGGAAGYASTGSPLGAAGGAAVAESVAGGAKSLSAGRQSRLMSNAERAINASRRPNVDLTGGTPPGWMVPPVTNYLTSEE